MKVKWFLQRVLKAVGVLGLMVLVAFGFFLVDTFSDLPNPADLKTAGQIPSVRIESRDGRLLYEAIDAESGRQAVLPLTQIPLALQQATVATEDRNFYTNDGVDVWGIVRAMWINIRGGEVLAGGSTITQQVTRNLLLSDESGERTLRRKLRESVLAWRISHTYEKEEILALYLNHSYYGAMAYGVEAAAQTYFGKSAVSLTLAESALIAGLPQAPGTYNPFINPETAEERQEVVLGLMLKDDVISKEAHDLALRQSLTYTETPYPVYAPHFVMMVKQQIDSLYTPEEIKAFGGLTVRTTLDFNWQERAEEIVVEQLERLNEPPEGKSHNVHNGALVALDPVSGAVRAFVGNPDYFDEENAGSINMALRPRQPGSAIKPLVYAAALSPEVVGGDFWTAATMVPDVRTVFPTAEGQPYVPVNFSREVSGPVLVREALASSLNIPAVAALQTVGMQRALDFTADMGIADLGNPAQYGLSFALGGGSLTLLDLTAAYGVFANGGGRVEPYFIEAILAADGSQIFTAETAEQKQVLDERVAWLISDILSDNQARTPGFGPNSVLQIDRHAAVKTGTTNNFHDNWAIGYTPDLVVGVWVGNANNEAMEDVTGVSGAGPIWHHAIRAFLAGEPDQPFERPSGMVQVEVCQLSGLLPTDACPYRRREWFLAGTQPVTADTFFQEVVVDTVTGKLAVEGSSPATVKVRLVLDLPTEFHEWARQEGLPLMADLLSPSLPAPNDNISSTSTLPFVSYPDPNSVFLLSDEIPQDVQRILIKVTGGENYEQLTLWMDGAALITFEERPYEFWLPLAVGLHRLNVTGFTPQGESFSGPVTSFSVNWTPNK